jgi:hypothetical protein
MSTKAAYPADHGFEVSQAFPNAINHHADIYVYDTDSGDRQLIDFTFTNAARSTGVDGRQPGEHADMADEDKLSQYSREFPGLSRSSDPALVPLSMERHGSFSRGTRDYWKERVKLAHDKQTATLEFPTHLSILTRRVLQTLAIALWRVNANHILSFHRRAFCGSQRHDARKMETLAVDPSAGV